MFLLFLHFGYIYRYNQWHILIYKYIDGYLPYFNLLFKSTLALSYSMVVHVPGMFDKNVEVCINNEHHTDVYIWQRMCINTNCCQIYTYIHYCIYHNAGVFGFWFRTQSYKILQELDFISVVDELQFYNQLDMLDMKSHRSTFARFMTKVIDWELQRTDGPDPSLHMKKDRAMIVVSHNDVIEWKHFPRYWPLWRESTGDRWIHLIKASDAEL